MHKHLGSPACRWQTTPQGVLCLVSRCLCGRGTGWCWNKVPKPHSPAFWDDNAAIWGSPDPPMFTGLHSQPREGAVVSAPAHHHIHGNMSPGQGGWVDDGHTIEHNFLLLMQGSQLKSKVSFRDFRILWNKNNQDFVTKKRKEKVSFHSNPKEE